MKKNILLLLPLIATASTFSMHKKWDQHYQQPLDQTVMIIAPEVTDESLGVWRSLSDLRYEADNLYTDLENKTYKPTNKTCMEKLDRTVDTFTKNNDPRLPKMLNLCRDYYKGQISIKPSIGLVAHTSLVLQKQAKLSALKTTLENNDKKFLDEQNKLLEALKLYIAQQIVVIKTNKENHVNTRNALLELEGKDIKEKTKAALIIRKLSMFTVPKNNQNTEDESQDPDRIDFIYNNQYLLSMMGIAESTYKTVHNTDNAISSLNSIYTLTQVIQPLRHQ